FFRSLDGLPRPPPGFWSMTGWTALSAPSVSRSSSPGSSSTSSPPNSEGKRHGRCPGTPALLRAWWPQPCIPHHTCAHAAVASLPKAADTFSASVSSSGTVPAACLPELFPLEDNHLSEYDSLPGIQRGTQS